MSLRVILRSKVKAQSRSRSESESELGIKLRRLDPKRSDLPMAKVRRPELMFVAKSSDELWVGVKG